MIPVRTLVDITIVFSQQICALSMASNPYNPPPVSSHHTVIVQPVVVQQPTVQSVSNLLFLLC